MQPMFFAARWKTAARAIIGWLFGVCLLSGCGATIVPPPAVRMADPVTVYVANYGVHSSLLLPTPDRRYVEYNFGDWGYAAENHTMPQDAIGALVLSFQSGLGRRYIDVLPGETVPHPSDRSVQVSGVMCERADVYDLERQLDQRFEAALRAGQQPVKNPENGLEFVKDSEHYSVANNCNQMTARSLEQLGCKIMGIVVSSDFHVAAPPPTPLKPASKPEPAVPGWNAASLN